MSLEKNIIILAKSIKHSEYCIAGKDIDTKEWVRLVSDDNGAAISLEQSKCTNDSWQSQGKPPYQVKVLHKVCLKLIKHAPLLNQPENYLISTEIWLHKFNLKKQELLNYLDAPESLWGDGDSIEYCFIQNNSIAIPQSLYLVKVEQGELYLNNKVEDKKKRRAKFIYKQKNYDLPVTDPNFDKLLNDDSNKILWILCISLGENFNGHCYKIVATIF